MKFNFTLPAIILLVFSACQAPQQNPVKVKETELAKVQWSSVASVNLDEVNSDLEEGKPTVDIGIYIPSNLDPDFNKVSLEKMMESYLAAKEIYAPTGVQLNLKFVKTGEIDPAFLAIQANEIPQVPATEYANTYVNMQRNPAELTDKAKNAFESIIEAEEHSDRTIYLIVLQDVFYPFLEVSEGRNWTVKSVRTGGLSFPTYSYVNNLPKEY